MSIAVCGNAAELLPELVKRAQQGGLRPDIVTDQTSAHDIINGYLPAGWSVERWQAAQKDPAQHAALKQAAGVSRIVRKRLRCSGIELGRVAGAHLLRHSLATELVERRRPINEIADLLGHRSINTTSIYVKVATSQLADVALPFPGGAA